MEPTPVPHTYKEIINISSIDNNGIKYSSNSERAFDKNSEDGISSYSGVYVIRMNDVILQR